MSNDRATLTDGGQQTGQRQVVSGGFESSPLRRVATDRQVQTMPTEWTYHSDGVETAVRTNHALDGELQSVRIQVDGFKVRQWTEEELDDMENPPDVYPVGGGSNLFDQHAGGSHATLHFDIDGGVASLRMIEPEDGFEGVTQRHMVLLRAAERILPQIAGVDDVRSPVETLFAEYDSATNIHIDAIDE